MKKMVLTTTTSKTAKGDPWSPRIVVSGVDLSSGAL